MSTSILQGGNSAPKDKVYLWNSWYIRRSFAPGACPWHMERVPGAWSAPLEHALGAKPLVCIRLNSENVLRATKCCNFFAFCMGIWILSHKVILWCPRILHQCIYTLVHLCIQHHQTTYLGLFQRKAVSEKISNFWSKPLWKKCKIFD